MICPNCKNNNDDNNRFCLLCGMELNNNSNNKVIVNSGFGGQQVDFGGPSISTKKIKLVANIINIFLIAPLLLIGIIFTIMGLYASISESSKIKGYEKVNGYFKENINCETQEDGEELCEALYEYEVGGNKYTVSNRTLSDPQDVSNEEIVYYDPTVPSESMIRIGSNSIMFVGIFFLIFSIGIIVVKHTTLKKILGDRENISLGDFVNQ